MNISGSVLSYDELALPGVLVEELYTNNSTTTDEYAKYSLNVAGPDSQIKFSKDGYSYDTYKASDITDQTVLYLENALNDVNLPNNYKKPDNTALYVVIALLSLAAIVGFSKSAASKPKTVTP
ncbi:MAG TPA: hypothetical protein VK528_14395 [Flavobacterium sp.]|nr:hypothetical protein [Flavobacterium sp.]